MAAPDLYMNFAASITPAGGSPTTLKNVLDFRIGKRVNQKPFFGGNRHHPVFVRNTEEVQSITIVSGDLAQLMGIDNTKAHAITVTVESADEDAAAQLIYTCAVSKPGPVDTSGRNNEYGAAEITFMAYNPSADTTPITTAVG